MTVVTVLIDSLVPTGYIRYAPLADGCFVFTAFASALMPKLLRPECSRFITPGLESEIYQVIERLIDTIGSPQIAIDERHTPKLYSRFLASLLVKRKRDGATHGRMPQQGPPTQLVPTYSSAPVYQRPLQQPQASHITSSTRFVTGVSGATSPDLAPSMTLNSAATVSTEMTETNNFDGLGNHTFDVPSSFTFGATVQQVDMMDFTFDLITTPGNEDMLAAMQAIQIPELLGEHVDARILRILSRGRTDSGS